MENQVEIWKDIDNYVGFYQISNYGRVKSLNRTIFKSDRTQTFKEKILKTSIANNGYYMVCLKKQGIAKSFTIHRLIALYFIKNDCNYPIINHKDGNKLNNSIENLEWCTYSDNLNHAYETKLTISVKGKDKPASKLTEKEVVEIRELSGKMLQKEIGEIYNIDRSIVCRIINRKAWNHI